MAALHAARPEAAPYQRSQQAATLPLLATSAATGETLAGLTDCTLECEIPGMKTKLLRTESALVLRVVPSGITVIFR